MQEEMRHEARRMDEATVSPMAVYKALAGTVLIGIGVVLGVQAALAAFSIIRGDDPPGLVNHFAADAAEVAIDNAEKEGVRVVDLTPDAKKAVLYVFCFFFLLLPVVIAGGFVRAGASLLQQDAREAMKVLAQQLRRPA